MAQEDYGMQSRPDQAVSQVATYLWPLTHEIRILTLL